MSGKMNNEELLKIMCIAYESVRSEVCHTPSMKLALDIARSVIESQERERCISVYTYLTDDSNEKVDNIIKYLNNDKGSS